MGSGGAHGRIPRADDAGDPSGRPGPLVRADGTRHIHLGAEGGRVDLEPTPNPLVDGRVRIDPRIAQRFGVAPVGVVGPVTDGWCRAAFARVRSTAGPTASVPLLEGWITARGAGGEVVGAAPLGYDEERAHADVALAAPVVALELGPHPFTRAPGWRSEHGTFPEAERIGRVGWWAATTGRTALARSCAARAAVGWVEAGDVFRAAWARTCADRDRVACHLALVDPALVAVLDAVESTGAIPGATAGRAPVATWTWAAGLLDLV